MEKKWRREIKFNNGAVGYKMLMTMNAQYNILKTTIKKFLLI